MGAVAAIAAVVGTVATVASTAYGMSQKAGASGGASRGMLKDGDVQKLNLGTANQGLEQYLEQASDVPRLQTFLDQLNKGSNESWQKSLQSLDPNILSSVAQLGRTTLSQLQGQIPQDVQDEIGRDSAFNALQGGYAGTGMARNLTSRDLGLSSLDMQKQGAGNLGTLFNSLGALNPSNANLASILFSPQQLLQRQDNQTQYNTDLKNQMAFYNAGAAAQTFGSNANQGNALTGIGSSISGLLGNKSVQSGIKGLFGGSGSSGVDPDPDPVTTSPSLSGGGGAGGGGSTAFVDPDPDPTAAEVAASYTPSTMDQYSSMFG